MNTCIISGGNIDCDFALNFIKTMKPDYLIAVDRGLLFADQQQLPIDLIVGDFDSVPATILARYRAQQEIPIRTFEPEKDSTDTQIAIEIAVAQKSEKIWIIGGTGSRMDHCLGNINCLAIALESGIEAAIVDAHNHISLLQEERVLEREKQYGQYVSFLPFGERVEGLNLEGFKYPLHEYLLTNTNGLGVSNEIVETQAKVSMRKGILIMIQSRD